MSNSEADTEVVASESAIEKKPQPAQAPQVPNGGTQAWLQCVGAFFLYFTSWGIINSWGTYQAIYEQEHLSSKNSSTIAWIGSIQAFLILGLGPFVGPLFDQGLLKMLLYVGTFASVFGMMMTSLCTEYWQLILAQGITVGLGFGCLFLPSVSILPSYFSTKRALAQGIAASGSSLGGIIYPIILKQLQPQIGLPWATRVLAFVMLATLMIPIAAMRMRTKPPAKRKLVDPAALREVPFVVFCIASFFSFLGLYIPFFFIDQFALQKLSIGSDLAFYLLPLLNAGSFFGRILCTPVSDRIGPINTLLISDVLSIILAFSWIAVDSTGSVIAFCLLYGLFTGAFVPLPPVVCFIMCPSFSVMGTWQGMCLIFMSFGLLIGNPIAGAILASGWTGTQAFCGAALIVSALFHLATRYLKVGTTIMTKI